MNNTNLLLSNHTVFILKSSIAQSRVVEVGPGGWNEEELEISRHKNYEGKFTQFTGELTFYKDDAEYIETARRVKGVNEKVFLTKLVLEDVDGDVKWVVQYTGIADLLSRKKGEESVSYKFNSDDLAELIKAHEGDMFEFDRLDSIDGIKLDELKTNNVRIEGRTISSYGESVMMKDTGSTAESFLFPQQEIIIKGGTKAVVRTVKISGGPKRFASADSNEIETLNGNFIDGNYTGGLASQMFFTNSLSTQEKSRVKIDYEIAFVYSKLKRSDDRNFKVELTIFNYREGTDFYDIKSTEVLYDGYAKTNPTPVTLKGIKEIELEYDEGAAITFSNAKVWGNTDGIKLEVVKHDLRVNVETFSEPSFGLNFMFVHEAFKRLMSILTGNNDAFYSKYFGGKHTGYNTNGFGSMVGLISGLWLRNFKPGTKNYKAMTLSLKDLLESCISVFNVGAVIEQVGSRQRLRIEDAKYFYQDRTVVILPYVVSNEEETEDQKSYYSGVEIGYAKGGDYENEAGLDEPNTQTNFISPVRVTKEKYREISKIRTDETQMEIQRRHPQFLFPNEDLGGDDDCWFLDLKEVEGTDGYTQKNWDDRLVELPKGVDSPEDYRAFLFTPMRMMLRHGWKIVSGMQPYIDKSIKYISAKANASLSTWFIGEDKAYSENEPDTLVSELGLPKYSATEVTFNHPVDDELLRWINGTTRIKVEGEYEDVPNFYFKMQWRNNLGEVNSGYLINLKPKVSGEFKFKKSNN